MQENVQDICKMIDIIFYLWYNVIRKIRGDFNG